MLVASPPGLERAISCRPSLPVLFVHYGNSHSFGRQQKQDTKIQKCGACVAVISDRIRAKLD